MKVIIAGGTGLIGQRLAASLVADGHEAIVLSRNPGQAKNIPAGARLEQWDGRSANGWGTLAAGAHAIVNLAGAPLGGDGFLPPRWSPALKQIIVDSRRNASLACLDAIKQAKEKPDVLIQASAIGYYGVHGDEILDEKAPAGGDFAAQTCVIWEESSNPVETMGVRCAVIRTGLVLDAGGGVFTRLALPFKLFAGGPLGNGRQWMSWIHIQDEISAIRFLMDKKSARGAFNLTAPNPVQNKDFARTLGRVLHRPAFMPAPAFAFRLAFGEVATLVVDGQRVVPAGLHGLGYKFKFETLEPALADIVSNK